MSEPAGWYGNPDGTPSQRYWDGARWTHDVRPLPQAMGVDPTLIVPPGQEPALHGVGDPSLADGGVTATPPASTPTPDSEPAPASTTGSATELFGALFDFGLTRSISPALVGTGYRVGVVITVVVAALFLLIGLQAGGSAAIISLIVFPLLALLWLIGLRLLCQLLIDRPGADGDTGSG